MSFDKRDERQTDDDVNFIILIDFIFSQLWLPSTAVTKYSIQLDFAKKAYDFLAFSDEMHI